jgi:hypothetical protein
MISKVASWADCIGVRALGRAAKACMAERKQEGARTQSRIGKYVGREQWAKESWRRLTGLTRANESYLGKRPVNHRIASR